SAHSVSLWYLFIVFENRCQNGAAAKALFYRAIRQCPWAKALYMLPFGELRHEFGDDELLDVHSLMEDKEVRIRVQPAFA
ncbi:Protein nrde2, partial [Cladochytrium tenue]